MATIKQVQVEAHLGDRFKIESKIGNHTLVVDQPKTGGGEDAGPTPLEYFFLSLAGCIGTIARIAAKQKRINLRGDGRQGFRGVERRGPDGAQSGSALRLWRHHRDGEDGRRHDEGGEGSVPPEVDLRCPVSDNIHNATPMTFVVE